MSIESWSEKCGEKISEALKLLLETKHLYQYVRLSLRETVAEIVPDNSQYSPIRQNAFASIEGRWYAVKPNSNPNMPPLGVRESGARHLNFRAPRVRMFCGKCNGVEPHDCANAYSDGPSFFLVYNCLSNCGDGRVTFLVEREKFIAFDNLRLSGRSPIERIATPASIPSFLARYYEEAVIAFSCGYVRMAILGLRTVIEQWARAVTGITAKIDGSELFNRYSSLLPTPFSSMYPSLGALYSDLSADVHGAIGDPILFERARDEIDRHFGALRSLPNPDSAISSTLARKK
jgi:hypothetical protein